MSFIDFAALKAAVTIDQAAETLGLTLKQEGSQFRTACPACKSGGDRAIVLTPAKGLFYCFSAKKGGDCIAIAAHILNVGNNDAANFLADQLGTVLVPDRDTVLVSKERATAPQKPQGRTEKSQPARAPFDPNEYLSKLTYSEEIEALGISEADAQALGIGFVTTGLHRGRIAIALRWQSGEIAGFGSVEGGTIKLPSKFIPPKVHVLKRA
jgi:DNA primase